MPQTLAPDPPPLPEGRLGVAHGLYASPRAQPGPSTSTGRLISMPRLTDKLPRLDILLLANEREQDQSAKVQIRT